MPPRWLMAAAVVIAVAVLLFVVAVELLEYWADWT